MPPLPPSRNRWFLLSVVAVIFGVAIWYFGFQAEPPKASAMGSMYRSRGKGAPPTPVRAVPVLRQDLVVRLRAIGTVAPLNTVAVRSRVEGQLLRVLFEEGQEVTKGQVLAEIDPLPFKIRLNQVEGSQRQNLSQLATARADLVRFKQLHAQTLVTQQQLEAQQSLVVEREGAVAADQAQVDDARRQLAYTKVEAPIPGRLGLRQIDVGNLVRPSDAVGLVVLTQMRPISVVFTVPEIDLPKVVAPMRAGEQLEVEAWDRSEQTRVATGVLKTVDNQIDLATGTLRLKAEFTNADEKLFPNQFVNIRLRVRTLVNAVVVPAAAVQYGSRGTYVFLINEKQEATIRDVVLGPIDGVNQAVLKGLEGGESVVLEGFDRLREGRSVVPIGAEPVKGEKGGKGEKKGKGEKAGKKDK
jgi:membrane fusion protein, multidrug efflux system